MKNDFFVNIDDCAVPSEASELCRKYGKIYLSLNLGEKDPAALDMHNCNAADVEEAAKHGYKIHMCCRGIINEEGFTVYAEPSMYSAEAELPTPSVSDGEELCGDVDNSVDIHSYYVRFAGDSRGWLDIVTADRWGGGIITKPITVKAMHNWAEHAIKYDPDLFIAGLVPCR